MTLNWVRVVNTTGVREIIQKIQTKVTVRQKRTKFDFEKCKVMKQRMF